MERLGHTSEARMPESALARPQRLTAAWNPWLLQGAMLARSLLALLRE